MSESTSALLVPGVLIALLSTGTTLAIQWLGRNLRKAEAVNLVSEAEKHEAEAELMNAQAAAAVMGLSRELMAELRTEVERQKFQHEKELQTLRAAVAGLQAEQERQRDSYKARIEALETKIYVLQAELVKERELRTALEAKYNGHAAVEN